mmetsp:Transcript_36424/g.121974  ORF Transcript_36424/g.121974 Transcript_36424/m.121974 type:complete len:245 (+) Transcript_36424:831-1565(+)
MQYYHACSTRSARAGGGTIPPPSAVPRGASRTPSRRRNGTLKVPPSEFAPAHAGASLMLPLPLVDKSSAQRVRRVRAPQSPLAKLSACPLPREAFAGSRCRRRRLPRLVHRLPPAARCDSLRRCAGLCCHAQSLLPARSRGSRLRLGLGLRQCRQCNCHLAPGARCRFPGRLVCSARISEPFARAALIGLEVGCGCLGSHSAGRLHVCQMLPQCSALRDCFGLATHCGCVELLPLYSLGAERLG